MGRLSHGAVKVSRFSCQPRGNHAVPAPPWRAGALPRLKVRHCSGASTYLADQERNARVSRGWHRNRVSTNGRRREKEQLPLLLSSPKARFCARSLPGRHPSATEAKRGAQPARSRSEAASAGRPQPHEWVAGLLPTDRDDVVTSWQELRRAASGEVITTATRLPAFPGEWPRAARRQVSTSEPSFDAAAGMDKHRSLVALFCDQQPCEPDCSVTCVRPAGHACIRAAGGCQQSAV